MDWRSRRVVDVPAESHYLITLGGEHAGVAAYELDGTTITFTHTETSPELQGQGVGGDLVMGALEDVRSRGFNVVPQCPFVKSWIAKHPEYADLVRA